MAPLPENGTTVNSVLKQFSSVFTKEDFGIPKLTSPLSPQMPEINIDIEGVKPLMRNLDPYKVFKQVTVSIFKTNGWRTIKRVDINIQSLIPPGRSFKWTA